MYIVYDNINNRYRNTLRRADKRIMLHKKNTHIKETRSLSLADPCDPHEKHMN